MPIQNRSHVPLGSVLEGKYRVTREIGRGGMAAVYEAVNVDIGKRVAVKVLAAELITSRVVRERFIREARASAAIRSPYICDVYDSGMYDERPFLVMELLEGESLYDLMTRVRRLDFATTIRVITHTCRGLTKAHDASIIHRDLKPENIFLTENEDGEMVAKILDFGLAKFYDPTGGDAAQARLTREGALFGTPAYMSPEQAKGQGEVDLRADLWALGCIAYECLTGQTVWNVEQGVAMILAQIAGAPLPRPSKLRADLPRSFDHWFAKALDRDIANRFQTAKEFAESITEALQPTRPQPPRPPPSHARDILQSTDEELVIDQLIGIPSADSNERLGSAGTGSHFSGGPASQPSPLSQPVPTSNPSPLSASPQLLAASPAYGADRTSQQPASAESLGLRRRTSNAGAAITTLLATGAVAIGAYAFWLYVANPPPQTATAVFEAGLEDAGDGPEAGEKTSAPLERESFAQQIGDAQVALGKGQFETAIKLLKEATANGGGNVAKNLLVQATAAAESKDPCIVTGIGRPRPFDLSGPAYSPALTFTKSGPLVAWIDNHLDPARLQGSAVLLDESLRRVSMTHGITPEARSARELDLLLSGDDVVAVYGDGKGAEAGVYARLLETDGRIAGSARRVAGFASDQTAETSVARAPDGTFWAVWAQPADTGVRDLLLRHLGKDLTPLGEPLRLTRLKPVRGVVTGALSPSVAIGQGFLHFAFSIERGPDAQEVLLRTSLTDPLLKTGLPQEAAPKIDRFIGVLQPMSTVKGKNVSSRIACSASGCFVVWDQERGGGAYAAYVSGNKGEKLWHRELSPHGSRPSVAEGLPIPARAPRPVTGAGEHGSKSAVAWFDNGKLKLAPIDRDGVGTPSNIAKVTTNPNIPLPAPVVVAGDQPGQWYLAWRDLEVNHLEAFVARAQCR